MPSGRGSTSSAPRRRGERIFQQMLLQSIATTSNQVEVPFCIAQHRAPKDYPSLYRLTVHAKYLLMVSRLKWKAGSGSEVAPHYSMVSCWCHPTILVSRLSFPSFVALRLLHWIALEP